MRKMTREEISLLIVSALCFVFAFLIFITLNVREFFWEYPWSGFSLVQLLPFLGIVLLIFGVIGLSAALGKMREGGKEESVGDQETQREGGS
jgi:uncharacterized membrane protein